MRTIPWSRQPHREGPWVLWGHVCGCWELVAPSAVPGAAAEPSAPHPSSGSSRTSQSCPHPNLGFCPTPPQSVPQFPQQQTDAPTPPPFRWAPQISDGHTANVCCSFFSLLRVCIHSVNFKVLDKKFSTVHFTASAKKILSTRACYWGFFFRNVEEIKAKPCPHGSKFPCAPTAGVSTQQRTRKTGRGDVGCGSSKGTNCPKFHPSSIPPLQNLPAAFSRGEGAAQTAAKRDGIAPWVQSTRGLRRSQISSPSHHGFAELQSSDSICTTSSNLARALVIQPIHFLWHWWLLAQQ